MHQYRVLLKPIIFTSIGLVLLIVTVFMVWQSGVFEKPKVELIDTSTSSVENTNKSQLTVEVSGEVVHPNVYKLPSDARVQDALIAAGNITPNADTVYIAKTVNKAAKLIDGQKIYIPGKTVEGQQSVLSVSKSTININGGSQSEIEGLPGIGPVSAEKIINGRPYTSLEELTSKKIVSASVYEKIKDLISLY